MASARLERTTVELSDGAGRVVLRATGQVVLFPGFLALYEEGRDEKADEEGGRMPALREGDAPAKTGVEATQHFTQPPPRYSEASLVKRLEELGIGRPSTYASMLQTLKDREYVRVDKKRFIPEESGRLVTAFLERFFERYVSYDYTAELEDELDDVSGGRLDWQKLLDDFWHDFKPKAGEVMEQKPSEITAALDEFLAPLAVSAARRWQRPADLPQLRQRPAVACAAASSARSSPAPIIPNASSPGSSARAGGGGGATSRPTSATASSSRPGASAPMSSGEGKRASIPKDIGRGRDHRTSPSNCCRCRAKSAMHPETGKPISASIGRYGPYLLHDGKYARLSSTAEVFETGMNAAVAKLADAASGADRKRGGARADRSAWDPSGQRQGDQGDGGALRSLRQRRRDPCDPAQGRRSQGGHAGRGGAADRREGGQGPVKKKGGRKPARKKAK